MSEFKTIDLTGFGKKYQGKVRDFFILGDKRILVTTDRISAFDRILGHIPNKGQILNQLSAFWFQVTSDIIENHMLSVPDPNVLIAKNTKPILIEMVVRGYMTGVTVTAIWPSYQRGERVMYGVKFPEGLKKNQKLPHPVITPTYHGDITGKGGHDTRLTKEEIAKYKLVPEKVYKQMEEVSLKLFERGSMTADKAGLMLVDTKYEFGLIDDKLILIDEIHTPDSSRFWIKTTYKQRFSSGEEPENYDKEFLRLWFQKRGYTGDGKPPKMTTPFIQEVSKRYQDIYERITGEKLIVPTGSIGSRIKRNLEKFKKQLKTKH